MAPSNDISMAQLCCCILKPIPGLPEGFSNAFRKLPVSFKSVVLFRCIIIHILVWLGWFLLIFWTFFSPDEPRFTVTDASTTQFNLSRSDNNTSTNLHYHLDLNITIRNPNRRLGFYYQNMTVSASYRKNMFGLVNLTDSVPFYQGHKNTTLLHHLVLQGKQQLVKFEEREMSQFVKESAAGVYSINLQVIFQVKVKFGKYMKWVTLFTYNDQKVNCKLKLPFSVTNDPSSTRFKATKCDDVNIFLEPS